MKKKVISAVLFGALVFASTNTLVSCKDYDDSHLVEQINEEKAKSASLQGELESIKQSLEAELKEARSSYNTQLAEARTALENAVSQKEDVSVVAALANRIVSLEEGLAAANATLGNQIETCNSALKSLQEAVANNATVAQLNAVQAKAASDLAALSGNVDRFADQLNKLSSETGESIASILLDLAALQAKDAALQAKDAELANKDAELAAKDAELAAKDVEILAQVNNNYQALLTAIANAKSEAGTEASAKISQEEAARIAAVNDLKSQIEALQAFQASIQSANFQQQINDLNAALGSFKSEVDALDIEGKFSSISQDIQTLTGDIAKLTDRIAANELSIQNLRTELATVSDNLTALNGQLNTLAVLIEKSLSSLVFKPSQYIYGFGTINVQSFSGCMQLKESSVSDATYGINGVIKEYTVSTVASTWAPSAHARYHMNPSTADKDKYDFSFVDVETQNALTRANDTKSIGATAGTVVAENGLLDVELKIAYPENLNDAVTQTDGTSSYAWVSTLALQATEKNTEKTVTSDYALVVPSYYGNLCLANNQANPADHLSGDNKSNHIRTSALATIMDAANTFEVPYNGTLDLSQYIETHYGVSSTATGTKVGDKAFTEAEFASSGLKYSYSLVDYKTATRENQASIAEIDEAGVTKVVDQDAKYIGETYVVRVLLQDGNNKNLAVGYVKILVVDQGAEAATVTAGIALNCDDPTQSVVAMSEFVDQFKESYSSSLTIADFKGTKYLLDNVVYSSNGTNPTLFGKGQFLISGDDLVLSLTSAEAKELYYANNVVVPQTIKVYAKFTHQADGYSDLWVEYIIDKDKIIYARGTFADADKIVAYWYEKDSRVGASAGKYDEIHANASLPDDTRTPDFNFNVLNTFRGQKAHITGINDVLTKYTDDPYADLDVANSDFNKRIVSGASGNRYQLVVKDNKTLSAYLVGDDTETTQDIVILSGSYFGLASYQTSAYAKDILNFASHKELAADQTFAVEIQLVQKRNCYDVELTDDVFQVKFLRPINVTAKEAPATTDAEHGGGYWYVQSLVEFSDWRDYKFDDHAYADFYEFYGVGRNAIVPAKLDDTDPTLIENATTDVNGTYESLAEVAPGIKLTWEADASNSKINGRIGYLNNGATVNRTFHIKVPMKITYVWGDIFTEVTLTVTPTINQLRRR